MPVTVILPSLEEYPVITGITQEEIDCYFNTILKTQDERKWVSAKFAEYQNAGRMQGNFVVPSYD